MKIALPSDGTHVDEHFGHCKFFTILTLDEEQNIVNRETVTPPPGCGCKSNIVSTLVKKGVSVMLAGNMGQGAVNLLEANQIQVVRGCSGPIDEVVAQWLEGKVQDQHIVCDHTDCGHHENTPGAH
jgi:predicted Fe-Mo cluster-binding NifX family protein